MELKKQNQEQPQEEMSDKQLETSLMWCKIIYEINEADKNGVTVGEFIASFLEKNFNLTRKNQSQEQQKEIKK